LTQARSRGRLDYDVVSILSARLGTEFMPFPLVCVAGAIPRLCLFYYYFKASCGRCPLRTYSVEIRRVNRLNIININHHHVLIISLFPFFLHQKSLISLPTCVGSFFHDLSHSFKMHAPNFSIIAAGALLLLAPMSSALEKDSLTYDPNTCYSSKYEYLYVVHHSSSPISTS
jgi:hypothetical protein